MLLAMFSCNIDDGQVVALNGDDSSTLLKSNNSKSTSQIIRSISTRSVLNAQNLSDFKEDGRFTYLDDKNNELLYVGFSEKNPSSDKEMYISVISDNSGVETVTLLEKDIITDKLSLIADDGVTPLLTVTTTEGGIEIIDDVQARSEFLHCVAVYTEWIYNRVVLM